MKIWLSSRPFHALDATVWLEDGPKKGRTVEEVAGAYVNHILGSHAAGPAILLGHGTGGVLAWETARQLSALGHPVAGLILIDTFEPLTGANADGFFARGFQRYGKAPFSRIWRLGARWLKKAENGCGASDYKDTLAAYVPIPLHMPVFLFRSEYGEIVSHGLGWEPLAMGGLTVIPLQCWPTEVFRTPQLTILATKLTDLVESFPSL